MENLIKNILAILKEKEDFLNRINVFPIADKDTGTNLYKTLDIKPEGNNCREYVEDICDKVAYSARGSSGNIIALYLMGLKKYYSEDFHAMCSQAAEFAWNLMYNPQEGTILTAMKAVPKDYIDFNDFIYKYYLNSLDGLLNGPEVLSILKERNTLDSGTLGFIYILCGVYKTLTDIDIVPDINEITPTESNEKLEYTYCVEILLHGNHKKDIENLSEYGNELIIINNNKDTKIHIHTNRKDEVIDFIKSIDLIKKLKVDNMETGSTFEKLF